MMDERDVPAFVTAVVSGMLAGVWLVAWLFHVGPDLKLWWSFPYMFTSVFAGFGLAAGTGVIAELILRQRRSRATVTAPHE